ncbi:hypothetical protein [Ornithinimicrobium sp. INDO-MA30-4]|uniref:hypothetical protein n=1 Tax=Ornithinimicrobium sp. INDO-MA30-4 TaxID=2908651 RepID=UPI001F307385|nr:hypothetical protein [Ornithinimicrobium sp. INDO-MA30-4]UJH70695.1 hypothetical protein L0A91_01015 [Ornithinimicrobium sp. INDO-MA30-4]
MAQRLDQAHLGVVVLGADLVHPSTPKANLLEQPLTGLGVAADAGSHNLLGKRL